MKIISKSLTKKELKEIEKEFEHDLKVNQGEGSGSAGRDVQRLLCHIQFLEKTIQKLEKQNKGK